MTTISRRLSWLAALFLATLPAENTHAETPVLTGRWGDTRMPEQLVYNSESKKTSALVVVAFSTKCPLARRMVPLLNELQAKHLADGVHVVALFPNGMDDLRSIAEYAVDVELTFPVFKDDAETPWHLQLGMKTTPQVVVLDTRDGFDQERVVYRGQINGRWFGGGVANKKQEYLADALASFLKGEPPAIAETAASGCPIARRAYYDLAPYAGVTYHNEIARLIQKNCLECHREGEPGAELFAAFDSYETVAAMSEVMLSRIENRLMPPWHADTDPNNGLGGFQHDPRLSEEEINQFRAWVAAECPAGSAADAPPPKTFKPSDQWQIGTPDFVFEMPEPYVVPKYRLDEYQYYRIRANFAEDRYIQAIETKPGNKAVVHHIGAIVGPASEEKLAANEAMLQLYGLTGDKVLKIGDYIAGDPFKRSYLPRWLRAQTAGRARPVFRDALHADRSRGRTRSITDGADLGIGRAGARDSHQGVQPQGPPPAASRHALRKNGVLPVPNRRKDPRPRPAHALPRQGFYVVQSRKPGQRRRAAHARSEDRRVRFQLATDLRVRQSVATESGRRALQRHPLRQLAF